MQGIKLLNGSPLLLSLCNCKNKKICFCSAKPIGKQPLFCKNVQPTPPWRFLAERPAQILATSAGAKLRNLGSHLIHACLLPLQKFIASYRRTASLPAA